MPVAAIAVAAPAGADSHSIPSTGLRRLKSTEDPPTIDELTGSWYATVSGLRPATLNGRWTLRFESYANGPGFGGSYRRVRNGKLVAAGSFSLDYTQFGPMLGFHDFSGPSRCREIIIGGVYVLHVRKKILTLSESPSPDPCRKRSAVFDVRPFRR